LLLAVTKNEREVFMYYLGIDVSKKRSDYLILDSQGERFQRAFSVVRTPEKGLKPLPGD